MSLGMLTAELRDSGEAFCNVITVENPQTEEMEISKVTLLNGKVSCKRTHNIIPFI